MTFAQENPENNCQCNSGWRKQPPGFRPCGNNGGTCPEDRRVDVLLNFFCEPLRIPPREVRVIVETRVGGASCDDEIAWDLQPSNREVPVILHGVELGPCTGVERKIGFHPLCMYQTATCDDPSKSLTRWSIECLPVPYVMPLPPLADCDCRGPRKIKVIDPVTGEEEETELEVAPAPADIARNS